MKKILIGCGIAMIAIIILRILDQPTSETERTAEIRCPYLIERDTGGKHNAVYYSS